MPDMLKNPDYMDFISYPEISVLPHDLPEGLFKIGIQLHTGKLGGNLKLISLKWISKLRRWLPKDKFVIYLFGTGDGYSKQKVERFCVSQDIENLVGKTGFLEWMGYIKAMDFFITPEGFSAFFAMSQKIRSLVFYTDYQILERVAPQWQRENIIISAGQKDFVRKGLNYLCRKTLKRNCLLEPLKPEQVWSLIYSQQATSS